MSVRRSNSGRGEGPGLADGEINHRHYVKLLMASGYDGPICIEGPRPGDREWFAQRDLAYLESVIHCVHVDGQISGNPATI